MEVGVSGPDGANTMYLTTGIALAGLYASAGQAVKENYAVHVGPSMTAQQFRRSIATAALANVRFHDYSTADADTMQWEIEEVDADFDDEAGQVQLRFTLQVQASVNSHTGLLGVSFTVTTLAEM
jgi:hypothetical protein